MNTQQHWPEKRVLVVPPPVMALFDASAAGALFFAACKGEIQTTWLQAPFFLFAVTNLALFWALGLYRRRSIACPLLLALSLAGVSALWDIAIIFGQVFKFMNPYGHWLIVLHVFLCGSWKLFCWRISGKHPKNILVLAQPDEIEKYRHVFVRSGFNVGKVLFSSTVKQLSSFISEVDSVVITPGVAEKSKSDAMTLCYKAGRTVFLVPDVGDIFVQRSRMKQVDDLPLLEVPGLGLSLPQAAVKRVIDIIFSLAGMVIAFPMLIISSLLIAATTPGPVVIAQPRVGKGERVYLMYKFRTMYNDAERTSGPVLATDDDQRITGVGRFLRSTRIDELPQLLNVLKGDMSIVGPRPERPFFVQKLNLEMPEYNLRHQVKPGITGLAQVAGRYSTLPEDKFRFDLYYIKNYSQLMDITLILKTIPVVLLQKSQFKPCKEYKKEKTVHNRQLISIGSWLSKHY